MVTRAVDKAFAHDRLLDDEYVDALAKYSTGDMVSDLKLAHLRKGSTRLN